MVEKAGIDRYEIFGWDYEQINPLTLKEINWYLTWARKTGGPVLELACGTGRLLCQLAKRDLKCVGVDLSPAMLSMAQANKKRLPVEVRENISFRKANILSLSLKRKFSTIIIADNSLSVLHDREQQKACLENARNHLVNGGLLLISVSNQDLKDDKKAMSWSKPLKNPIDGKTVIRTVAINNDPLKHVKHGEYKYKVIDSRGIARNYRFPFSNPSTSLSDYLTIFREMGFKPKVYGDFNLRKSVEKSKVLCFAACKI